MRWMIVAAALAVAGCAAGVERATDACAALEMGPIPAYADCIRGQREALAGGPPAFRQYGPLYLSLVLEAEESVATGRMTETQAVAGLARVRAAMADAIQNRRQAAFAAMSAAGAQMQSSAAMMQAAQPPPMAMPRPIICHRYGATTICN